MREDSLISSKCGSQAISRSAMAASDSSCWHSWPQSFSDGPLQTSSQKTLSLASWSPRCQKVTCIGSKVSRALRRASFRAYLQLRSRLVHHGERLQAGPATEPDGGGVCSAKGGTGP